MSKLQRSRYHCIFIFFETVICFSCGILFLLLMKDVWEKFQSKMMMTNTRWRNDHVADKLFPWFTICPSNSFKTPGTHYTAEAYLNNTYTFDEIIDRSLSQKSFTFDNFDFKASETAIYGSCYTFFPKIKTKAMEKARFYLRRTIDIKIFIHVPNDEYWLNYFTLPFEIAREVVKTSNSEGIQHVEIAITELNSAILNESGFECSQGTVDSFRHCVKEKFREEFGNITCVGAGVENLFDTRNFSHCNKEDLAHKSVDEIRRVMRMTHSGNWFNCLMPCNLTSYKIEKDYFHKNTGLKSRKDVEYEIDDAVSVVFYYKTLLVEEQVEARVFDLADFLAAGGGNLGLALGFSCLSTCITALNYVKKFILKLFF